MLGVQSQSRIVECGLEVGSCLGKGQTPPHRSPPNGFVSASKQGRSPWTLTRTSRSLRCGGFGTGDCISAFRLRISEGLAEEVGSRASVVSLACGFRTERERLCIGRFVSPPPLPS